MNVYEIQGKEYPVIGQCKVINDKKEIVGSIPIVDVPMMSDYKWQLGCLVSRLKHPEYYPEENIEETICKIKRYLAEHNEDYERDISIALAKES